ncbi:hypothetical protein GX48_04372 [Paracoccidioides brasiliensis]|nr:hypothetical protein GX48_04372 [Paracoccidioides brasiliensis]
MLDEGTLALYAGRRHSGLIHWTKALWPYTLDEGTLALHTDEGTLALHAGRRLSGLIRYKQRIRNVTGILPNTALELP